MPDHDQTEVLGVEFVGDLGRVVNLIGEQTDYEFRSPFLCRHGPAFGLLGVYLRNCHQKEIGVSGLAAEQFLEHLLAKELFFFCLLYKVIVEKRVPRKVASEHGL